MKSTIAAIERELDFLKSIQNTSDIDNMLDSAVSMGNLARLLFECEHRLLTMAIAHQPGNMFANYHMAVFMARTFLKPLEAKRFAERAIELSDSDTPEAFTVELQQILDSPN